MAELWELHAHPAAFLHIIDTSRLLGVLRDDNRAIFRAASQASKASDFILAFDQGARGHAEPVAA
jgi:antirestriction protein ArdC